MGAPGSGAAQHHLTMPGTSCSALITWETIASAVTLPIPGSTSATRLLNLSITLEPSPRAGVILVAQNPIAYHVTALAPLLNVPPHDAFFSMPSFSMTLPDAGLLLK